MTTTHEHTECELREQIARLECELRFLREGMAGNGKALPLRIERIETQMEMIKGEFESSRLKNWRLWLALINSFLFPIFIAVAYWMTLKLGALK